MSNDYLDHKPLTEQQALGLLDPGIYEAYVYKAEIKSSKKGERYFVLYLEIINGDNKTLIIDWLTLPYKVKHFYEACGMEDKYSENKLFINDCSKKLLKVKVGLSKPTEKYPNINNTIIDYIKPDFVEYNIAF